jgi:phosphoribosylglycinamide formyltransferase-1
MNVVVLISGRGSNLKALLEDQRNYRIRHVISNNHQAAGLDIAQQHGVSNTWLDWSDKQRAEHTVIKLIKQEQAELVILAGFMKILSPDLVSQLYPRVINIHPSLLPDYPGLNTHQRALDDQRTEHGATVHLVDSQLDHGPRISQTRIAVDADDTASSLAERLLLKEHKLLTHTVGLIAERTITWEHDQLMMNSQPLTEPLHIQ